MKMSKRTWPLRFAALYAAVALGCLALLYGSGLLPQDRIYENIQKSSVQFELEGEYPYVLDAWDVTFRLDAFSESLILNHSYFMDTRSSPVSILTNPAYRNGEHPVQCLMEAARERDTRANSSRSRYWMGFRALVRPLLCLYPYQDIRSVISIAFFSLLFAAMLCLRREAGSLMAMGLGLTALAMNPVVVSTSLQYSCCFLIALSGIIAVCLLKRKPMALNGLFLVLGQLTQYFDFYTTPLITWGLPFVALLAIRRAGEKPPSIAEGLRLLLSSIGMWAGGYVGMWVLKMILTTCFTEENGFAVIQSFLYYTGLGDAGEEQVFSIGDALFLCVKNVFTNTNRMALLLCVIVLGGYHIARVRKEEALLADGGIWIYAVVACLPVLWIACSKQASGRHSYFQYRTLAASVFAAFAFMIQAVRPKNPPLLK